MLVKLLLLLLVLEVLLVSDCDAKAWWTRRRRRSCSSGRPSGVAWANSWHGYFSTYCSSSKYCYDFLRLDLGILQSVFLRPTHSLAKSLTQALTFRRLHSHTYKLTPPTRALTFAHFHARTRAVTQSRTHALSH